MINKSFITQFNEAVSDIYKEINSIKEKQRTIEESILIIYKFIDKENNKHDNTF